MIQGFDHAALNVSDVPEAVAAPEAFLAELEKRLAERGVAFHRSRTGVYFCDPGGNFLEVTCWREKSLEDAGAEHG